MRPAAFASTAGRTKRASRLEADELGWAGPGCCMGMPSSLGRMERHRRPSVKDAGDGMCDVTLGANLWSKRKGGGREEVEAKPRSHHAGRQGGQPARGLVDREMWNPMAPSRRVGVGDFFPLVMVCPYTWVEMTC